MGLWKNDKGGRYDVDSVKVFVNRGSARREVRTISVEGGKRKKAAGVD